MKSCSLCSLICVFREAPEVKESLPSRFLIAKLRSDKTDLFRNFAVKIAAIPLQDEVHGHGNVSCIENTY